MLLIPFWALALVCITLAVIACVIFRRVRTAARSAKLFRSVAEGSSDGLVLMERDSRILWCNAAYSRIMGYDHGELLGRYPLSFALPSDQAISKEEAMAFRFDESDKRFGTLTQVENVRKDGTKFFHEFSHAALKVGGKPKFLLAGRDITERIAREKELLATQKRLEIQSVTDGLTGLFNRAHLQSVLNNWVARGRSFSVLEIDLNLMKKVNDTYGHLAGDALIVHVVEAMKAVSDDNTVLARIGGDEFTMLRPDINTLDQAIEIGDTLVAQAAAPFFWRATRLTGEISVGAAIWEPNVKGSDDLLHRADLALYEAKRSKTLSVVGYTPELRAKHTQAEELEADILSALRKREFTFHFQPLLNVNTHRVEKFEMLARWRDPKRGMVPPDRFLPIIAQLGFANTFDKFALAYAEQALERLSLAGLSDVGLSMNVSADAFQTPEVTDLILWLAECDRVDPSRLCFEILESTSLTIEKDSLQSKLLARLRSAGFGVFLDDFGMGYAGLAHLANLPSTGIKIDRSLTSVVDTDTVSRAIVISLVKLGRELGLEIVTEGVENTMQMEIVRNAGCVVFQGYAIAKPMPLKRAIAWSLSGQSRATPKTG